MFKKNLVENSLITHMKIIDLILTCERLCKWRKCIGILVKKIWVHHGWHLRFNVRWCPRFVLDYITILTKKPSNFIGKVYSHHKSKKML